MMIDYIAILYSISFYIIYYSHLLISYIILAPHLFSYLYQLLYFTFSTSLSHTTISSTSSTLLTLYTAHTFYHIILSNHSSITTSHLLYSITPHSISHTFILLNLSIIDTHLSASIIITFISILSTKYPPFIIIYSHSSIVILYTPST
jgi:hypothetical protein